MTKGPRRLFPRSKRARVLSLAGAVLVAGASAALLTADCSRDAEAERLAELLALRPGMTVAEIGAGTGWLTVDVAARVGTAGRVYSTELSPARRDDIRQAVAGAALTNVIVIEAGEHDTNLPSECCDAIFMRDVYHHFTHPTEIARSVWAALKPGGRLAVVSFHSLEDRIVKRFFQEKSEQGIVSIAAKKPVRASDREKKINPRSRSARLRAAKRLL